MNQGLSHSDVTFCPACGSAEFRTLGGTFRGFEVSEGGHRFEHPNYEIRECCNCLLCFKSRILPPDQLLKYYDVLDFRAFDHDGNFPTDAIARKIIEGSQHGSRILDFGCSTGRLLASHVSQFECYGVEINAAAAAIAAGRGLKIITPDSLRNKYAGLFDLIIMTDIYEHLTKPAELLRSLLPALKLGGSIVIVTGNSDAVFRKDRIGEHWYFRLPGHLLMGNPPHFHWLAKAMGLQYAQQHLCSHYTTLPRDRLFQWMRSTAYYVFKNNPSSPVSRILTKIPKVRNAESWQAPPPVTYKDDHIVAVLRRAS
jgi:SAM-dependent methyltransferase